MHLVSHSRNSNSLGRSVSLVFAGATVLLVVAHTVHAQGPNGYPKRPIQLSVPYGPGGVGDQTMRVLANKLSDLIKQQVVIENRPSAGGILSMSDVLRAPADGYTLGEMGNGQAISASLFTKLRYNLLKDFRAISVAATFSVLMAVQDNSPYKSLPDLVDYARKNPGKLNMGAINPGSTQNLSAHLFQQVTGIKATIVTYRTSPDLATALLRGDVDLGFDYYAALESVIGSGRVRIIATASEERDPVLMNIPTARESGFPNYFVSSWNGIGARATVPTEIIRFLNTEINNSLAAPDVKEKFRSLGIEARGSTPEEMWERMARDSAKWREVIDKAGIPKQ